MMSFPMGMMSAAHAGVRRLNVPPGLCFPPFIATANEENQVSFLPGCGLACVDSGVWYSDSEYESLRHMIIMLACMSLIMTTFTSISCLIDPRQRQFPGVLLLNINICLFASSIAWIWAYSEGDNLVCRDDGTLRLDAPSGVGDFKCVLSFMVIFYFTLAAHVWFVLLAIAWNFAFLHIGRPKQKSTNSTRKLLIMHHVIAWSLPALLTGAAVGTNQIDGLWLGKVCNLSLVRKDNFARVLLLVVPEGVTVVVGALFLARGAIFLETLRRKQNKDSVAGGQSNKLIKETIVKIGIFCFLLLVFDMINVGVHITESAEKNSWIADFETFVECRTREVLTAAATSHPNISRIISGDLSQCATGSKPKLGLVYLGFMAPLFLGILMGMWGFNRHSLARWKQLLAKVYMKLTYRGEIDLQKERVAASGDPESQRRGSDRSVRSIRPQSAAISMHEMEMYSNPLVNAGQQMNFAPPSPVSPVNVHADPISYVGNRVSVTVPSTPSSKTQSLRRSRAHAGADGLVRKSPSDLINPYSTWHGSPRKCAGSSGAGMIVADDHPDWRPTPPKRDKSNRHPVQLLSHRSTSQDTDTSSMSTYTSVSPDLNRLVPREQMSLPKSIVGTGRYFLQAADFKGDEESAESALFHGRPLSEKDKKRAVVVIEMTEEPGSEA